ncbi:type III secretion system outer membrane ring subunit SctC (plasmid) [Pantoea sp. BJ2]|uniref:Type 3 secretion system secretin n=1 Tax=Pantoea sp. BJ2 TaxID=3141322 RepID=A0AAU7U3X4_9GAMM
MNVLVTMKLVNKFNLSVLGCSLMLCLTLPVYAENASIADTVGYTAEKDSLKTFFEAVSTKLHKPIIASPLASKKRVTGSFDLSSPDALISRVCNQMGLIWYSDGQSVFIYDASETKSTIVTLVNTSVASVKNFLVSSKLYDTRYPIRDDAATQTFYISGPPAYIKIVTDAVSYLESKMDTPSDYSSLNVIPLYNTFVSDRFYRYRDEQITIPGMATIISQLTGASPNASHEVNIPEKKTEAGDETEPSTSKTRLMFPEATGIPDTLLTSSPAIRLSRAEIPAIVIPNPDNNSLLVKGSREQVRNIRTLINGLDLPRRHIEMSVWIIDLQKQELDQLGVNFKGSLNMGNSLGVSLNGGGTSTVDGASFMAAVLALTEENKANIVSRPMILTQENVPAVFDNNRTFYTKLQGERVTNLEHVTYGTSLNVLPRFTQTDDVELLLNIEDGNELRQSDSGDMLPEVGRTQINTIARVPKGKSLLVGGYSREEKSETDSGIPGLKNIPWVGKLFSSRVEKNASLVRIFLIQPKEIYGNDSKDARTMISDIKGNSASDKLLDWTENFMNGIQWPAQSSTK